MNLGEVDAGFADGGGVDERHDLPDVSENGAEVESGVGLENSVENGVPVEVGGLGVEALDEVGDADGERNGSTAGEETEVGAGRRVFDRVRGLQVEVTVVGIGGLAGEARERRGSGGEGEGGEGGDGEVEGGGEGGEGGEEGQAYVDLHGGEKEGGREGGRTGGWCDFGVCAV